MLALHVVRHSSLRRVISTRTRTFSQQNVSLFGQFSSDARVSVSDDERKSHANKNPSMVKACLELSKARLSSLVVATTAAGFIAAGGPLNPATLGAACVGTALCSSSASAWNQIFEIDRDSKMKRTQQRPLVTGVLSIRQAQILATSFGLAGTSILAVGTDPITTMLGAGNIVLYAGVYTHMKPNTKYNTWMGAVVGAIPPVMGWTAAGGHILDMEAMLLGATLYLWQMPHFFALSYMHRVDYKRGGFAMVPVLEEKDGHFDETASLITRYTWYMSTIPIVATLADVTSSMFALEGIVLNTYALHVAKIFSDERTNANARKVFLTSLWYLPSLLMLFLLHSRTWDDDEAKNKEEDAWRQYIAEYIHLIRDKGRQICIHEMGALKSNSKERECPVSVAKKKTHDGIEVAANTVVALKEDTETNK